MQNKRRHDMTRHRTHVPQHNFTQWRQAIHAFILDSCSPIHLTPSVDVPSNHTPLLKHSYQSLLCIHTAPIQHSQTQVIICTGLTFLPPSTSHNHNAEHKNTWQTEEPLSVHNWQRLWDDMELYHITQSHCSTWQDTGLMSLHHHHTSALQNMRRHDTMKKGCQSMMNRQ